MLELAQVDHREQVGLGGGRESRSPPPSRKRDPRRRPDSKWPGNVAKELRLTLVSGSHPPGKLRIMRG
jgi:hypothetical protein